MSVLSKAQTLLDETAVEPPGKETPGREFLNRELSWLEFNRRVLHEALDDRTPLLERVNFLSIFSSNLDEFYMKRVGGLKRQVAAGVVASIPDGMTPLQQLAAIRRTVLPMLGQQADCYRNMVLPALAENDIHLLDWDQLTDAERDRANDYFARSVFAVLTPLAVDPGHPFPFISNLSTSLGVTLHHPDQEENLFARIKVPQVLPSWVRLDAEPVNGRHRLVSLIDIIRHNLDRLFPGMTVLNVMPFRITRNADVDRDEEDADDLLEMIEEELRRRRFEKVVRLEHCPNPDPWMLNFLMQELHITEDDVYELPALLDYTGLRPIASMNLPKLRYKPWTPVVPTKLADDEADIFSLIRRGDILLHHPYESFNASVERFIRSAADDPTVLAIKMTVYRTGTDSLYAVYYGGLGSEDWFVDADSLIAGLGLGHRIRVGEGGLDVEVSAEQDLYADRRSALSAAAEAEDERAFWNLLRPYPSVRAALNFPVLGIKAVLGIEADFDVPSWGSYVPDRLKTSSFSPGGWSGELWGLEFTAWPKVYFGLSF